MALSSEYAADALLSPQLINKVKLAFTLLNDAKDPIGVGGLYYQRYFFRDLFIALHQSERGKGSGGKLLDSIIDRSVKDDVAIFLQTYKIKEYSQAIVLYENRGFKLIGEFQKKIIMCSANTKLWLKLLRISIFYAENFIKYVVLRRKNSIDKNR